MTFTKMSQISWCLSQQNQRRLVIGGHEVTKKQETKNGDRDKIQSLILHRDVWLCDGTFKVCPIRFYQLYSIHIQLAGFNPHAIMHFCQTKEHTKKGEKGLSAITENTEPHRILLNFGRAALNPFASHTGALLKDYYFHLCQEFNRKINDVSLKRL